MRCITAFLQSGGFPDEHCHPNERGSGTPAKTPEFSLTPPHSPPWGGLRCFAKDPDGYLIELEENEASPFLFRAAEPGGQRGGR